MIPFQLKQSGEPRQVPPQTLNREVEIAITEGTNRLRTKKELGSLSPNALLKEIALEHSQDMKKRKYLSHFSPEGKSVMDRTLKRVAKVETHLGENIHTIRSGRGLYDAQAISQLMLSDWMKSKSHRKNLLSKNFTQIGVGCASDGFEIFCTQVFSGPNLQRH
ncbi:MAG: CAP domain-containing protein [bacterium]|nr:CAP domain-containing protein [bacterium]